MKINGANRNANAKEFTEVILVKSNHIRSSLGFLDFESVRELGEFEISENGVDFYRMPISFLLHTYIEGEEEWVYPEYFTVKRNSDLIEIVTHSSRQIYLQQGDAITTTLLERRHQGEPHRLGCSEHISHIPRRGRGSVGPDVPWLITAHLSTPPGQTNVHWFDLAIIKTRGTIL